MDDLSEKLTGILNDPESMERVKQMAESILGGGKAEPHRHAPPCPLQCHSWGCFSTGAVASEIRFLASSTVSPSLVRN